MGSVENFSFPKKLIALAGMDPSACPSGRYVGKSKMSKRGNRHLRRAIYLMSASVVSQNAFFKVYFIRRKRGGLIPQKALRATAHKLIRVITVNLVQMNGARDWAARRSGKKLPFVGWRG
jgi:transposase